MNRGALPAALALLLLWVDAPAQQIRRVSTVRRNSGGGNVNRNETLEAPHLDAAITSLPAAESAGGTYYSTRRDHSDTTAATPPTGAAANGDSALQTIGQISALDPDDEPKLRSGTATEPARVRIQNNLDGRMGVYQLDEKGKRQLKATLAPGKNRMMSSASGRVWVLTDAHGKALGIFKLSGGDSMATIGDPRPPDACSGSSCK